MNFLILGTTEFTLCCAKALIDVKGQIGAIISMPFHTRPLNSADLAVYAKKNEILYHEIEDINSKSSVELMKGYSPDYILSSWPQIIKKEVLNIPKRYIIGSHPTDLPFNRGRHPLHWLIVQGISETKLSFFKMDEGVDTGKILSKIPVKIAPNDTIRELLWKINKAAYEGIKKLYAEISREPDFEGIEQDNTRANYWRKRTPHDVTIDFRMNCISIVRTVRSFAQPYICANLIFENHIIKIHKAAKVQPTISKYELQRIEPGKIISTANRLIRIKAADGIVELESRGDLPDSLLKAKYIHPPAKYLSRWPQEFLLKFSD